MPATHLRILVVEDEPLIRWSIAETLAQFGHDVSEAADAESALLALSEKNGDFDVVLLDYRLPDSADLALLATIRRLAPRAAVVMMTAHGTAEMARDALELGVYRVMDKPFDMHALEPMVLDAYAATR